MGKMSRNRGIFAAGKEMGEHGGYAVNDLNEPIPQYNGMIGIRKVRTDSDAYVGVQDENNWLMGAPTGNAGEVLYVLIADDTTRGKYGDNTFQNLGRRTADMEIPEGLSVRWYRLQPDDFFDLGAENFATAVSTNGFAEIIPGNFDLAPVSAEPASGQYFVISSNRTANIGGSSGGKLYLVDYKVKA